MNPRLLALLVGSDIISAPEHAIASISGGSSSQLPIDVYMFTKKLLSFDVTNTITSYVQQILTPIADPTSSSTNAIWKSSTTTDVIKYKNAANTTIYNILSTISAVNATTGNLSGNGTGSGSATPVMVGVYATITPTNTGRIQVTASGNTQSGTLLDGCRIDIRESSSYLGAPGSAASGIPLGNKIIMTSSTSNAFEAFARTYDITGLTIGTKYYFDVTQASVIGGTCTVTNVNWFLKEF